MEEYNTLDYDQFILFVVLSSVIVFSLQWIELLSFKLNNTQSSPNVNITLKTPYTSKYQTPQDSIESHDRDKIYDPLKAPTRRIERGQLPSQQLKKYLDITTRGDTDNYQQIGILIKENDDQQVSVLRLYGRRKYPGSYQYEYYTAIPNGLDNIKIPIEDTKNKELYTDDKVTVLNQEYNVKIYPLQELRYSPNI